MLCSINFFPENRAVYETRWKNVAQPVRPQMAIRRTACWVPKATNTHSQYVLLIAFPLQQWLHKRASMLRLYVHCLSCYKRNGVRLLRGTDYLYTYVPIQTYTAFSIQRVGGPQYLWIWIYPADTQLTPAIRSWPPPTQKNTDTVLSISPRA